MVLSLYSIIQKHFRGVVFKQIKWRLTATVKAFFFLFLSFSSRCPVSSPTAVGRSLRGQVSSSGPEEVGNSQSPAWERRERSQSEGERIVIIIRVRIVLCYPFQGWTHIEETKFIQVVDMCRVVYHIRQSCGVGGPTHFGGEPWGSGGSSGLHEILLYPIRIEIWMKTLSK